MVKAALNQDGCTDQLHFVPDGLKDSQTTCYFSETIEHFAECDPFKINLFID